MRVHENHASQRTSAPSAPSARTGAMEHPASFRVHAGQFDDAVDSIGANRRCPLHRKVTLDLGELGHEERIGPVNDLRIEIRKWSTAEDGCSVRESWTSWRKLDRIAATRVQPRRIRIWYRVDTAPPP